MTQERTDTAVVKDFISSLRIGLPDTRGNLMVFPLYTDQAAEDGYVVLDDALGSGKFTVTEMSEEGRVPELRVVNGLDRDVLLLDGEQLIGAKQNRIVNTTVIVGKRKETVIPVSCVEQGRWRYRGKHFSAGASHLYADLRAKKAKSVTANLRESRSFRSDQSEVWRDIDSKSRRMGVCSETSAMSDIYEKRQKELKTYEESFTVHPGQAGFVALIGGRVAGLDIFGTTSVLIRTYGKLLSGYILDALDKALAREKAAAQDPAEALQEVKKFLREVGLARKQSFKSAGEGDDLRFGNKRVNGFALLNDHRVVHLAAFAGSLTDETF